MMQSSAEAPLPTAALARGRAWMTPRVFFSALAAGLVTGIIGVIRAISYASLIFSGSLAVHLSTGVGMVVFSTGIITGVVAATSTLPGIIATPLAAPATILAILAGNLAQDLSGVEGEAVLATVLVAIALSSLLTGLMFLGLGKFRLGQRIRFVPYPVIGGFMAGTGWLLLEGFFQVTADLPLTLSSLPALIRPEALWCWLPGVGFTAILLVTTKLWKQFWVLPTVLLGCAALFFGGLLAAHISLDAARAAGWLLGPFPDGRQLWQPISPDLLRQAHWAAIAYRAGDIVTVAFVSLLSLLLSNGGIELVVGQDLNLNEELQAVGVANLASGLGGGMVGSQALPSTLLVNEIGANYRLTGFIAVIPAVAVLVLGSAFLSYLPKAVLGSLVLYLGASLLWQWLYKAFFKLPLGDYLTVWLTLAVVKGVGFPQGIAAGFVLTVVLFMYHYSQVDVVKQVSSGASSHSNVERNLEEMAVLHDQGDQIHILELQGFLFFGTANYLLSRVRDRAQGASETAEAPQEMPVKYVVIDFRQVSGLDSSAVLAFSKILRLAHRHDFTVVLTNLHADYALSLEKGKGLDLSGDRCKTFPDLDRGLEWCEQQLLSGHHSDLSPSADLATQLASLFLTPEQSRRFVAYLQPQDLPAGHPIFRPGEARADLYFIESGQVSVLLELDDGRTKRLQTCTSGHLLGEMRFHGKLPLSSAVVTDTPSRVYGLSRPAFDQMQQEAPDLAQMLQRHIVEVLCESLMRRGEQLRVTQ